MYVVFFTQKFVLFVEIIYLCTRKRLLRLVQSGARSLGPFYCWYTLHSPSSTHKREASITGAHGGAPLHINDGMWFLLPSSFGKGLGVRPLEAFRDLKHIQTTAQKVYQKGCERTRNRENKTPINVKYCFVIKGLLKEMWWRRYDKCFWLVMGVLHLVFLHLLENYHRGMPSSLTMRSKSSRSTTAPFLIRAL